MLDRFKRLESFRAWVSCSSVTQAAKLLHKVPSAVSYDLAALQRDLGITLLIKNGRGLALTVQGRILAEAVQRADRDFQRTLQRLSQNHAQQEPLRVCAVSGFGRYRLVPNLLHALPKDRPLEVSLAVAEQVLRQVETGTCDFGLSYKPLVSTSVSVIPITDERLVMIGPPQIKQPKRSELAKLSFITYDEFEYVYQHWFAAQGIAPPERWQRSDHYQELEEAIAAVRARRGFCVVPLDSVRLESPETLQVFSRGLKACRNTVYLLVQPNLRDSSDVALIQNCVQL
jgi:DNA-binding transcriptional LysR family regulator